MCFTYVRCMTSEIFIQPVTLCPKTHCVRVIFVMYNSYAKNATATGKGSKKDDEEMSSSVDINPAVEPYAEAVLIGSQAHSFQSDLYKNGTRLYENVCHKKYPDCPVTSDEVMEYIEKINLLDY